jgi:hypothetical protein
MSDYQLYALTCFLLIVDRSILLQDKYLSPSNKINLLDNNIPTHKPLTFEITIGAEPKPTSLRISYNFQSAN